jgi:chromatin remodeling complex protein RSC6
MARKSEEKKRREYYGPNGGTANLFKMVSVDNVLEAIIKVKEASRPDIVKLIWLYVKAHNLQRKGRKIQPDFKLSMLTGSSDEFDGFKLSRFIENHIIK